jgi:hypothetical protein
MTSLFPENDIKLEDLFLEVKYDGPSFDGVMNIQDLGNVSISSKKALNLIFFLKQLLTNPSVRICKDSISASLNSSYKKYREESAKIVIPLKNDNDNLKLSSSVLEESVIIDNTNKQSFFIIDLPTEQEQDDFSISISLIISPACEIFPVISTHSPK